MRMSGSKVDFDDNDAKTQDPSDEILNGENEDLINAYFKQRSSSIFKSIHSGSESSLGVLNMENCLTTSNRQQFSESSCTNKTVDGLIKNLSLSDNEPSKSELNLIKQRELAKKALLQLNEKLGNVSKTVPYALNNEKFDAKQKSSDSEKKCSFSYLSSNGRFKYLFDENQSPQTPMYFRDELNSMSESSADTPILKQHCKMSLDTVQKTNSIATAVDNVVNDDGSASRTSDLFESRNPDEIINRFEEDEKKFIKDQSALTNNSEISQFSGVLEDETPQWPKGLQEEAEDGERMSIGRYFELRSNSISSIVGIKESSTTHEDERDPSTLVSPPLDVALSDNGEEKTLTEEPCLKNNSKRWHSSLELKRISETGSVRRYSDESLGSTSTLLIQNLLCGMDSGLSGTQINDRLIECVNKIKKEKEEVARNAETPKSSRTGGRFAGVRNIEQDKLSLKQTNYKTSVLEGKKVKEFKENFPRSPQPCLKTNQRVLSLKNEYTNKGKTGKGFDSSTPKMVNTRAPVDKFKTACSKLLMSDRDWEPPRISTFGKLIDLNDNVPQGETETTLVETRKGERTLENTIADGDLTLLSERISEMHQDTQPYSSRRASILTIVQKLANYPKGSVDCSALTPLLRDRYPELLSSVSSQPIPTEDVSPHFKQTAHESRVLLPGAWVNMASKFGYSDNLCIPIEVKKQISTPVENVTEDWLIISLESLDIQYQNEKCITGAKINDEFLVDDFLAAYMKDTLIPPKEICNCKIYLTPKVPVTLHIKLKLRVKKMISNEFRYQDFLIKVSCLFPQGNISVTPANEVNFGIIPQECSDVRNVQIAFDGVCDLPLKIFIDEFQNFTLMPDLLLDGQSVKATSYRENEFQFILKMGRKSVLEFKLKFNPSSPLDENDMNFLDFKSTLFVNMENCTIREIPVLGSIGFAKFHCSTSCSPLIFRTSEIGLPVTRPFRLRNVGSLDLEFSIFVVSERSNEVHSDDLFSVPQSFSLPRNEEGCFDVTFSGKTKDSYVKRYLVFRLKPNGRALYDVELIGVVMPAPGGRSISRYSGHSGPAHSAYNPGNVPFKLKSTTHSLSWPSASLEVEYKQTFHIMNASGCNAMARFSFKTPTSSFKFLNDNGEVLEKLRKVLKPNCSNVMTVIFRPQSVGPYLNAIIIQTNDLSGRKMISVNGYGGTPKIFIRNLKSDLNGLKIIRLLNSEPESQIFRADLEFINRGNIAGFVSIKTVMKVLSLNQEMQIEPSNFVLLPNSRVGVKICQKLKNDDMKRLLSGRDIGKLATVTVTTGDEAGRYRMRKLVAEKRLQTSETVQALLEEFKDEKNQDVDRFDDEKSFESIFLKNLETIEIAAVVEKPADVCEQTILEDFEETVKEFVTILPASDCSVFSVRESDRIDSSDMPTPRRPNLEKSSVSAASRESSSCRDKKIAKWLATLEKP